MMLRYWLTVLGLLALMAYPPLAEAQGVKLIAPLAGESEAPPNEPQLYRLSLDPASEPKPALKYELLPGYGEQTPGNGAQYYYRALLMAAQLPKEHNTKFNEQFQKWNEAPLAELPKEDMQTWLNGYLPMLGQVKVAVYREQCEFDLRLRELRGLEMISFLLHDFQEMRHIARVLRIKARLEIEAGKLDDARETLRMGYKLAQDSAKPPLLINGLIGVAIVAMMNEQLLEVIASPDSPNMYWALAALPDPIIDMRPAMRQEMQMPLQMFPFLKDAETAQRTPEEWRNVVLSSLSQLAQVDGRVNIDNKPDWKMQLAAAALLMKVYPDAKRALIDGGLPRDKVEAMPVGQVVAIQASRSYFHTSHEMHKWTLLPFPQAWQKMAQTMDKLQVEGYLGSQASNLEVLPIASLLLPATSSVVSANARIQSQLAGLRVIEALRMHAAANDRKLPRSLDEITLVPVPNDPSTGKPFSYRLDGNKATLDVPAPATQPVQNGKRFEITIAPVRAK